MAEFPNLSRWRDVVTARPAVVRGQNIPEALDMDAVLKDKERIKEIEERGRRTMQT